MAFATPGTAADHADDAPAGKSRAVQATLNTGHIIGNNPTIPYDEAELRRFLRGGLAAK